MEVVVVVVEEHRLVYMNQRAYSESEANSSKMLIHT